MDWSGVDYCDVLIRLSFWRHPFTAEHPLRRHWCSATLFWLRNKLIYILYDLKVSTFLENLHFWVKLLLLYILYVREVTCLYSLAAVGRGPLRAESGGGGPWWAWTRPRECCLGAAAVEEAGGRFPRSRDWVCVGPGSFPSAPAPPASCGRLGLAGYECSSDMPDLG